MPAFYAGKRVGKPLLNGHTYNALFNGKLVWPLDRDTVVSTEATPTAKDGDLRIQLEYGTTAHEWMRPDNTSLKGGVMN